MLVLFLALAAASPTHDARCDSQLTNDLLACGKSAVDHADAALNAQWKKMNRSAELVRAQRAWLAWRDAECEAENYAKGGREEEIVRMLCIAALTDQRVKQLQQNYEWAQ